MNETNLKKQTWKNTMKYSTFTHISYPSEPEGKPACVHHGLLLLTDSTNYKPITPSTVTHQHIISADGRCVWWYLRMAVAVRSEGLNMKDKGNTGISETFFFAFFWRKLNVFMCAVYCGFVALYSIALWLKSTLNNNRLPYIVWNVSCFFCGSYCSILDSKSRPQRFKYHYVLMF